MAKENERISDDIMGDWCVVTVKPPKKKKLPAYTFYEYGNEIDEEFSESNSGNTTLSSESFYLESVNPEDEAFVNIDFQDLIDPPRFGRDITNSEKLKNVSEEHVSVDSAAKLEEVLPSASIAYQMDDVEEKHVKATSRKEKRHSKNKVKKVTPTISESQTTDSLCNISQAENFPAKSEIPSADGPRKKISSKSKLTKVKTKKLSKIDSESKRSFKEEVVAGEEVPSTDVPRKNKSSQSRSTKVKTKKSSKIDSESKRSFEDEVVAEEKFPPIDENPTQLTNYCNASLAKVAKEESRYSESDIPELIEMPNFPMCPELRNIYYKLGVIVPETKSEFYELIVNGGILDLHVEALKLYHKMKQTEEIV